MYRFSVDAKRDTERERDFYCNEQCSECDEKGPNKRMYKFMCLYHATICLIYKQTVSLAPSGKRSYAHMVYLTINA